MWFRERTRWRVESHPTPPRPMPPQLSLLDSLEYSDGKPSRPRMGRGSRGPRPRLFAKGKCQADGCSVNLSKLPFYYQRNHVCTEHNKCPSFRRQVGAILCSVLCARRS